MTKPGLSVVGSADAVSVTIPIPHVPQQIAIGAAVFAAIFFLILVFRVLSRFTSIRKEDKKEVKVPKPKKPKEPDPHSVVAELQRALISEMKGTSRQNTIMIALTIVFIVTSVVATAFSAQLSKILAHTPSLAQQLINSVKSLLGK
jgi:hypothetical protein